MLPQALCAASMSRGEWSGRVAAHLEGGFFCGARGYGFGGFGETAEVFDFFVALDRGLPF